MDDQMRSNRPIDDTYDDYMSFDFTNTETYPSNNTNTSSNDAFDSLFMRPIAFTSQPTFTPLVAFVQPQTLQSRSVHTSMVSQRSPLRRYPSQVVQQPSYAATLQRGLQTSAAPSARVPVRNTAEWSLPLRQSQNSTDSHIPNNHQPFKRTNRQQTYADVLQSDVPLSTVGLSHEAYNSISWQQYTSPLTQEPENCEHQIRARASLAQSYDNLQPGSSTLHTNKPPNPRTPHRRNKLEMRSGNQNHRCLICDAGFDRLTDLHHHIRIHSERKHTCEQCGGRFLFAKDLRRHRVIHDSQAQRFLCPFEDCKQAGFGFKRRDHRDRHVRKQHGFEMVRRS